MSPFDFRLLVEPATSITLIGFVLAGITLGTVSGLMPGLHANNFALFLASIVPSIPGPPTAVGATMLAAGVTHTFLDVIPALALGVPDEAMAVTALPGHQLVIDGHGREALRLSAVGSATAALLAVPLAIPITVLMVEVYPFIRPHLSILLAGIAVFLIATESTRRAQLGGLLAFVTCAGLGLLTLDLDPAAPLEAGGMLAPLFAGLFGAPVLLDAIGGAGVPRQREATIRIPRRVVGVSAFAGTVAGAAVGYLPGVSSAIAAVLVLTAVPAAKGARSFIVATSGINTANTIFALFALVALGSPRTGVLVAIDEAGIPLNLPVLLGAIGFAAAVSTILVVVLGDRYLRVVRQISYAKLSIAILTGLIVVAYLFAGLPGVGAFVVAAILGLLPPRTGSRRVHCMGVLMGPLILAS